MSSSNNEVGSSTGISQFLRADLGRAWVRFAGVNTMSTKRLSFPVETSNAREQSAKAKPRWDTACTK